MAGPRSTAKRSYRKRVAKSPCKGIKASQCRNSKKCKLAVGKKRSFCRKIKNQPRRSLKKRVMKKKSAIKKSTSYKTLSARSSSSSSSTMKTMTPRSSYRTPRSSSKKRSSRKINKRVNSLYKKVRANH